MIWHILYVIYCIDQGARGVSVCQEARFVGCAVFLFPSARACPRRLRPPAGGGLGLAICSSPGTCMFTRERERRERAQLHTSLPRLH